MTIFLAAPQHPVSFSMFSVGYDSLQRLFTFNYLNKCIRPQPGNLLDTYRQIEITFLQMNKPL